MKRLLLALVLLLAVGAYAASARAEEITLLYTGETHAMLYPCNCPIEPDGGVSRRVSLVQELRKKIPHTLLVDSGAFFAGAGPEASVPSAGLLTRLHAAGIYNFKGFDSCSVNSFFAHTFDKLPRCITEARLCVRLKPCGDICGNDSIGISFTAPSGALLHAGWGRYIGGGNSQPGLLQQPWCSLTDGRAFCLDLAALPLPGGGTTNLLPYLNQYGLMDFVCQDDSAVDYLVLELKSCCCREDIVVSALQGECGAVVNAPLPVFLDNCPGVSVACLPPLPSFFPIGTTTVVCTGTDASGNAGRCTFQVRVVDPIPPQVSCPTDLLIVAVDSNCQMRIPAIKVQAWDNCTPASLLVYSQNPPPNTVVPGQTCVAVVVTVFDASGNAAQCVVKVCGQDRTPPQIHCPGPMTIDTCRVPDLLALVSATDNCTPAAQLVWSQSPPAGSHVGPGTNYVTVTVKDQAGNVAMCKVMVIVLPSPGIGQALVLYNTGVDNAGALLPDGAFDPHYTLLTSPGLPCPPGTPVAVSYPWFLPPPTSKWIAPIANNVSCNPGTYVYRTTVDLTGLDPNTASIFGLWAADNSVQLFLNGMSTVSYPPQAFGALQPFTLSTGFIPGLNTLDFVVNNEGIYTGLRVELRGSAQCATCAPPAIVSQPVSVNHVVGSFAVFNATATGQSPLSYRWHKNGMPLSNGGHYTGVTSPTLLVTPLAYADAAYYHVVVTNPCGKATSQRARLTVSKGWPWQWDQWDFSKPRTPLAGYGSNWLEVVGPGADGVTFGTTETFGLAGPGGAVVPVMRVPQLAPDTTIRLPLAVPQYGSNPPITVVMDVFWPSNSGGRVRGLLSTDPSNTSEPLVRLDAQNRLVACCVDEDCDDVDRTVSPEGWHRLACVLDPTNVLAGVRLYLDGVPASCDAPIPGAPNSGLEVSLSQSPPGSGMYRPLVLCDNNGETAEVFVTGLQIHAAALSAAQIASLGPPSAAGLPQGGQSGQPSLRAVGQGGLVSLSWTGDQYLLQESDDLIHWEESQDNFTTEDVGGELINTVIVDPNSGLLRQYHRLILAPQ